jgi:hypothetical protein
VNLAEHIVNMLTRLFRRKSRRTRRSYLLLR